MKALILNSGTGSRMGNLTKDKPKCLVPLNRGETILSRQLKQLRSNNITEVLITTGPFGNEICKYVEQYFSDLSVDYVENRLYDTTNYIYSMYLAKDKLDGDILLIHGDIVISDDLIHDFINNAPIDTVIVDRSAELPEKDFKARIENNRIKEISIDVFGTDAVFLLPVYKLSRSFMSSWLSEIDKFVTNNDVKVYAENAFNSISDIIELTPWDLTKGYCMEVDNPEDLHEALLYN